MLLEESAVRCRIARRDDDRQRDTRVVERERGQFRRHLLTENAFRIEEDEQDPPAAKLGKRGPPS